MSQSGIAFINTHNLHRKSASKIQIELIIDFQRSPRIRFGDHHTPKEALPIQPKSVNSESIRSTCLDIFRVKFLSRKTNARIVIDGESLTLGIYPPQEPVRP